MLLMSLHTHTHTHTLTYTQVPPENFVLSQAEVPALNEGEVRMLQLFGACTQVKLQTLVTVFSRPKGLLLVQSAPLSLCLAMVTGTPGGCRFECGSVHAGPHEVLNGLLCGALYPWCVHGLRSLYFHVLTLLISKPVSFLHSCLGPWRPLLLD